MLREDLRRRRARSTRQRRRGPADGSLRPDLRSVDALLSDFSARIHWGKLHFLTPERLHALYPEADRFIELRRKLDPRGVFLNAHLRDLFA